MADSRISRPDLESEVYVRYRYRKDKLKLKINFAWFHAVFRKVFSDAGETIPSANKVQGFLERGRITLQSVRDKKSKTVEERIDKVRDQLCRYDDHQWRVPEDTSTFCIDYGRTRPEFH